MRTRRSIAKLLFGVATLSVGGAVLGAELNAPAPEFSLMTRNGKIVSLADLRGKVVMINFWATWCGPCRKEMPLLDALYKRYQRLGFELLGINVEEQRDDAEMFLKNVPVSFPILFDPENAVSGLFDVAAMPSTVFVDRRGNLRLLHHGYKPGDENIYQDQIRELIRERS